MSQSSSPDKQTAIIIAEEKGVAKFIKRLYYLIILLIISYIIIILLITLLFPLYTLLYFSERSSPEFEIMQGNSMSFTHY